MAFTAGLTSFKLPETKGQPMPETINDVEYKTKEIEWTPHVDPLKVKLLEEEIRESE